MKAKGRVLKIKPGYNPNSSSIGIHISLFVKGTAVVAALVTLVLSFIAARRPGRKREKEPA
jgi:hypothetical protein